MLERVKREQVSSETLLMPVQDLHACFVDDKAPGLARRHIPKALRRVMQGLPLMFSFVVAATLVAAFKTDGQLTVVELILISLMALLAGWEAIPSANAVIGFAVPLHQQHPPSNASLTVAILATIRDECAEDVIAGKLSLLRSLQHSSRHVFVLHILSDSSSTAQIEEERRMVWAARLLPVFHHHRPFNIDFKAGNIRNWIGRHGAAYDAFIVLDADSELDPRTVLALTDALAADPACGLLQTVPQVLPGNTYWQRLQSIASGTYGELQGLGLSLWMGDEANFYGHNAIIRTKAFAACAGLPHITGQGLWNGTILSHDFVEAALLRRAGWAVRILPCASGSFEHAPKDVVAHLKRDARWCLGNFQHARVLHAAGLHVVSRFHMISGILSYLSSVVWFSTLVLWAMLDSMQTGTGGILAATAFVLIAANLLLPRILGIQHAIQRKPRARWEVIRATIVETIFSSLIAPSMMLQRVRIVGSVLINRKLEWPPLEKSSRSLVDCCFFHGVELLLGLRFDRVHRTRLSDSLVFTTGGLFCFYAATFMVCREVHAVTCTRRIE